MHWCSMEILVDMSGCFILWIASWDFSMRILSEFWWCLQQFFYTFHLNDYGLIRLIPAWVYFYWWAAWFILPTLMACGSFWGVPFAFMQSNMLIKGSHYRFFYWFFWQRFFTISPLSFQSFIFYHGFQWTWKNHWQHLYVPMHFHKQFSSLSLMYWRILPMRIICRMILMI